MDIEPPAPAQPQSYGQQPSNPVPQVHPGQPAPAHQNIPQGLPFGMSQEQLDAQIENLIGITGTDREQALAALRAAYFDLNTAVNFVFEGIPQANNGFGGGAPIQQYGDQGVPDDGDDYQGADNPEANQGILELQQLMSNPAFQQIRAQARANPQLIPQILEYLRVNNPNLHQLLIQNQELQQMLLLGRDGPEAGGRPPRGSNVIQITQEENDAIERVVLSYSS